MFSSLQNNSSVEHKEIPIGNNVLERITSQIQSKRLNDDVYQIHVHDNSKSTSELAESLDTWSAGLSSL
jgi:hypothetical protein